MAAMMTSAKERELELDYPEFHEELLASGNEERACAPTIRMWMEDGLTENQARALCGLPPIQPKARAR